MLRPVAIACVLMGHLGCYDPSVRDCAVTCHSAAECAGGQACSSDGFCVSPQYRGRCERQVSQDAGDDEQQQMDAPPPDTGGDNSALAACQHGCTAGTCDAQGVCVIDCSASGACSETDVVCPAGLPCRVMCGDHACAHHVQCTMATSCEVQCSGASACGDEIECPLGRCDVTCSGDSSCHNGVKCQMSCACDVMCSGTSSCGKPSVCPHMLSCVLGRGCTSTLNGCDSCM
jgi:hypothetical protein